MSEYERDCECDCDCDCECERERSDLPWKEIAGIAAIIGAVLISVFNHDGWGWLILLAFLIFL